MLGAERGIQGCTGGRKASIERGNRGGLEDEGVGAKVSPRTLHYLVHVNENCLIFDDSQFHGVCKLGRY
ncbi:hypothetical protein IEQ34_021266 [Dendrobium chrysotoxum]|uniref:Uncharacterized protein n=1 Tax=Dendrobium chrysotoxum TaxID=161865 RepID=A0AAV7G4N0_DENCH|nr:hypothetical protein IEQ34_021266 [Dendrobium chrysotoxum]